MTRRRITEYLDLDLDQELWFCGRCEASLGPARENYKRFLLVRDRDPREVHHSPASTEEFGAALSPDPEWCRIVEYFCPNCATMFEVEYLPPGHPLTHDIELDIDALKIEYS
jgi:acetone carboxylase gamma subunit